MPRAKHPWAEAGTDEFEYLDTIHGKHGMNLEVDQGEWDPCGDDEGNGEQNSQELYNAKLHDDFGSEEGA